VTSPKVELLLDTTDMVASEKISREKRELNDRTDQKKMSPKVIKLFS
jgi:hypothetical protein